MENISQPQDKFVTVNSLKLHYLDWGNPDAPPMLLLHGLCGNAHYWDFFAHSMKNDYHVLALDQRGHGVWEYLKEIICPTLPLHGMATFLAIVLIIYCTGFPLAGGEGRALPSSQPYSSQ